MPIEGTCLCEQIRVTLDVEKLPDSFSCFCVNCKKAGSGTMSIVVPTPRERVKVEGKPSVYKDKETMSGIPMDRLFCGNCGSPILTSSTIDPANHYVKATLFGNPIPQPTKITFQHTKEPWLQHELYSTPVHTRL
ncbi:hypothetical protein SISNIDRAFT_282782 [Sistotremastrum niveocremeum HHB9708]|uniref:CENP-V/GFA domain-containing protein n=2 Tax=Sistotremastraceae TaxID=3402574 RepID=A0A164Y8C5_9AGAM|nr:hypothetical protein SISNIDRAFT_282782 [Sistotremastrum niveocremeum HHB9708]KZT42373.1 hypothetical protein SISSUDRAFT_81918 [Sistotremastrum suecicum HHB10207 ss-3]